jgi:hypothetical protein
MPLQRAMVDLRIDVLTCIGARSLKKAGLHRSKSTLASSSSFARDELT